MRKLWRLGLGGWTVGLQAEALLCSIRALLPIFGLRRLRRLLNWMDRIPLPTAERKTRNVLRIVGAAASWCPIGSTCLSRALTAQTLLRRAGVETHLCIGVMRDGEKKFQAHAWLQMEGVVIFGGSDEEIRQWIPLAGIDERTV